MSNELTIIRDPSTYSDTPRVDGQTGFPYQLVEGTFCGNRNASTEKYQTFSPYVSNSKNISDIVNEYSIGCDLDPTLLSGSLVKSSEDVYGNMFMLFKDVPDGTSIIDRRNTQGILKISNDDNEYKDYFGNLDLSTMTDVLDIQVFFEVVIIQTEFKIWIGDSKTREFVSLEYNTIFKSVYHDGTIYMLFDRIGVEYQIVAYKNKTFRTITSTPLTDLITSVDMVIKHNRVELVYVNTDTDNMLTFAEYDLNNNEWTGVVVMDFPYEILGVCDDSQIWRVFYEAKNDKNVVAGVAITFYTNPQETPESTECDVNTGALEFSFTQEGGLVKNQPS